MTTSPVMSVTDELIAELERSVRTVWPDEDAAVLSLRALLSERAELKRDAERYRWLMRELGGSVSQLVTGSPVFSDDDVDAAIDAAMQS